jgi:hypothetical protein
MYYIGYSAQLYCLWEYESVHVCGQVLGEELTIPTSKPELEWFMDGGCMAALLSLRVSKMFVRSAVLLYAQDVVDGIHFSIRLILAIVTPCNHEIKAGGNG